MFCCTLLYVHSSIAIILVGKRELIALLNLSSWCLVMVERLFLAVPRGCLQFVIVVFPDHTHLLFFIQGIPDDKDEIVTDPSETHLVMFDDMLGDKDEEKIKLWFTRKGHHRNASVVNITQNLFQQSKSSRTISLNAHYLVLFHSPRDKMQIKVLANQLQAPHMIHAFNDATSIQHGYLLVDLKPNTPDYLRFRTQIVQNWFTNSDQQGPVVYFPGV